MTKCSVGSQNAPEHSRMPEHSRNMQNTLNACNGTKLSCHENITELEHSRQGQSSKFLYNSFSHQLLGLCCSLI